MGRTSGGGGIVQLPVPSGPNVGQIQINPQLMITSGAFELIDLMKTTNFAGGWNSTSSRFLSPANMDANGYPTSLPFGDVQVSINTPGSERVGQSAQNYVILFDGTGTLIANGTSYVGTGPGNRNVLNVPGTGPQAITIAIHAVPVTNIHVYHIDDEPDFQAGKIAGKQFKARIKQAQTPVLRGMVWMGPGDNGTWFSNMTTWSTRKPVSYVSYNGSEFRPSLFAGTTTNSGNDYSITLGSGGPVNNQLIHLFFNASQAEISTFNYGTGLSSLTFTSGTPGTVNWGSALPASIVAGAPIIFGGFAGFNAPPEVLQFRPYYVKNVISAPAGTFTISTTNGGTAINFSNNGSSGVVGTRTPTLNLNGTGAVPIWDQTLQILWQGGANLIALNTSGDTTVSGLGTLLYNSAINVWTLWGGQNGGTRGIGSGMPPEIFLQFCAEVGCHPWFTSPQFACDPMTDWHTELARYCYGNAPSWMVPRFECINEPWNFGSTSSDFCRAMALVNFGSQDHINEIGKIASTIGQDIDRIYGSAVRGKGTKYHLLVNPQSGSAPSFSDQLNSTSYLAQSAPPQAGYNKTDAASKYLTHVCITQYTNVLGTSPNSAVTFTASSSTITWTGIGSTGLAVNSAVAFRLDPNTPSAAMPAGLLANTVYYIVAIATNTFSVSATKGGTAITVTTAGTPNVDAGSIADQTFAAGAWNLASGNSSLQQTIIDLYLDEPTFGFPASAANNFDGVLGLQTEYQSTFTWCQGFTNDAGAKIRMCGYEGGVALGSQSFPPQVELNFWNACMNTGTNLQLYCTQNYNNFMSAGGEHPSLFNLSCSPPLDSSMIWSALADIYQTPDPQEWKAVVSFS